jgi:hypothetical protein
MPRVVQPSAFRLGLKLIGGGALVFVAVAAAWVYFGHHFWTALKGPTEVTLADIGKMSDPRELPSTWVKVKLDKVVPSNVVLEEVGAGTRHIEEEYLLFQAGDRWMIASVPPGFAGNEISGQIWRNNAPLAREIIAAVADELKDVHRGKLIPYQFHAGDDYGTNWKCFAGVMALFGGVGLILTFVGVGGVFEGFRPPGLESPDHPGFAGGEGLDDDDLDDGGLESGAAPASFPAAASSQVDDVMARILRDTRR